MKRRTDGRWVRVKKINGKSVSFYSTAETEKKALKDIEAQMLEYSSNQYSDAHNFKILAEKMLEFQSQSIGHKTIESYSTALRHLSAFNDYSVEDITPAMVQNLLDKMAKLQGYSFSSVSKVKVVFGLILDYAIVHENLALNNFTRSIKIPKGTKKGKVSSPPDFVTNLIIESADKTEFGMWAMLFLCTGLRRGEQAALQRKDIDFDRNEISVLNSVEFISNQPHIKPTPKTEASIDTIPIIQILRPHLVRLCENLKPDDFIFGITKPLTETQIKKRWKKYCRTIGYSFNGHQLRHAYAKLLYKAGIDPKTMQRLLRHADFSTTMNIYTDFSNDVTDKSVEMLNNFTNNLVAD